ncbi:MAG: hypothetical protein KBC30_07620 [Planctomycetes bacterium]|nr:hypothetical protein [Planctomycetota bacterium]
MLLWGGKVALGRQCYSGEGMLLWGGKCCSGEGMLLWGGKVALGRECYSGENYSRAESVLE